MSEEWGPWIDHDGKGCPCVGMWVQAEYKTSPSYVSHGILRGNTWEGRPTGRDGWNGIGLFQFVRYRIRKPRGLTTLEEIAKGVKEPQEEHA